MIVRILLLLFILSYSCYIGIPILILWIIVRKYIINKKSNDYNNRLTNTINEYGNPSKIIRYGYDYMLIYQDRKQFYIQNKLIKWESIIDYRIPHEHNNFEIDNKNMFKRTFLGWLLFGDLGGAIGGLTGKKVSSAYKRNKGCFHLLIQTKDIQFPNIHLLIKESDTLEEIISCLNIAQFSQVKL